MRLDMGDKKFYTIPFVWSRTLWIMTFALFGLWLGYSAFALWKIYITADVTSWLVSLIVFNVVMLPTVLICEGLAPQRLEISKSRIVILRRYNSVTIEAQEIESIELLPKNALRGAVRMGGVSGFFGWFGNFYTFKLGSFKLYATNFENLFLVTKWGGQKIVFSCSEPEKIEQLVYGQNSTATPQS